MEKISKIEILIEILEMKMKELRKASKKLNLAFSNAEYSIKLFKYNYKNEMDSHPPQRTGMTKGFEK